MQQYERRYSELNEKKTMNGQQAKKTTKKIETLKNGGKVKNV